MSTYHGVNAHLAYCLKCESASRCFQPGESPSRGLVGALVGAFSVIMETDCETDGSSAAINKTYI